MKGFHFLRIASISISGLFLGLLFLPAFSQENLIVNGTFKSDSGWNALGLYNDGDATGTIEDSAYLISISQPGTELWSIQLTQSHLKLSEGVAYVLSFEISSSINRTMEVTISRNGGDYVSYSGKDTLSLSPVRKTHRLRFIMRHASDNDARLEFNCGMTDGIVSLRNVVLSRFTEKILEFEEPYLNTFFPSGKPIAIAWSGVNITGSVLIDFSDDNGLNWDSIGFVPVDSSPFIWVPEGIFSPWCYLRVSSLDSPSVSAVTNRPFEIAPLLELLKNGSFVNSDSGWFLGVNGARASGSVTSYGGYELSIIEKGEQDWTVQLTQDSIVLKKDKTYRCSFLAMAQDAPIIDVNIGMNDDPYTSYLDSATRYITLSSTPLRYTFTFLMTAPDDSSARFEFNCGKATGTLFFDDVSIIPDYSAPAYQEHFIPSILSKKTPSSSIYLNSIWSSQTARMHMGNRAQFIDVSGRLLNSIRVKRPAQGVYIIRPKNGIDGKELKNRSTNWSAK